MWDSSAGTEVASFSTGHGLSHLQIDSRSQVLHVGHNSGVVTTWPLALGRQNRFLTEIDLRFSLKDGLSQPHTQLDPTSLTRFISVIGRLGDYHLIGFENGDLLQMSLEDDRLWLRGWKVFQSKIEVVGGSENSKFFEKTKLDRK